MADGEIDIDEISLDLYKEIEKCAPFGVGNPKPVFIIKNVSPIEVSMFGKEKNHLKIVYEALNAPKGILSAIAFFKKEDDFQVKPKIDEYHNLVAHIEKSTWLGRTELRFRVVDIF
jgi:single-stranded-DNA-specific exonuclease